MLLHEILTPARALTATIRFRESFKAFQQAHPALPVILRDFIEFRLDHRPDQPFGNKDTPFSGPHLHGFRHFHMVHGRVILIYRLSSAELALCCVTDHRYSTAHGKRSLSDYLNSEAQYTPLSIAPPPPTLSREQCAELNTLFFQFGAEDPDELRRCITDDVGLEDLLDFMRRALEPSWTPTHKTAAILQSFGGVTGLVAAVKRVLDQVAPMV